MKDQPTDEELLEEGRRLLKSKVAMEAPRPDAPLRSTGSVVAELQAVPSPHGANDIHGVMLSLHAICTYASKAVAEYPISATRGPHIDRIAPQGRAVLAAVEAALPSLFQATGRPMYSAPSSAVEELRGAGGWLVEVGNHAEAYAIDWFARLSAMLSERLSAVLAWATEHDLQKPVLIVRPVLGLLVRLQDVLDEAQETAQPSSDRPGTTFNARSNT